MLFRSFIGSGFICSIAFGGSGKITGAASGFLGCTISTVNNSGAFFMTSNLKLGTTTKNKICSKTEQITAQISVLSLKEVFFVTIFKISS